MFSIQIGDQTYPGNPRNGEGGKKDQLDDWYHVFR